MQKSNFFLGAGIEEARFVFLLPNMPILPDQVLGQVNPEVSCAELVTLNGNHWRKILTIMAKLTTPALEDWRAWRDEEMLGCVSLIFNSKEIERAQGIKIVVGNTFREAILIPEEALVLGEKHRAYQTGQFYWCPYLDYRQFPNALVEELRALLHSS